ncbi:uncharacterized protein isoform X2 [Leptinotarsa decemlineata]|uniref:uncharacterized protein isoform X2 n=1 Tax=Leptinotarsa decemlineata TaxID=7539 RepID=UPI000C25411F|nr:pollen-specific leucine-rich repeat extensin-like protein 1 isoform X2 [Leptinotarsa decemlineata]
MVCKDEVLLWFKDLDGHKRIDVLYELLNMCLPFEIRFMGLRIEELGKHTYQDFRAATIIANDVEKLTKDTSFNQGIFNETVRSRVLIYLPLLSSRNYNVAAWFYRKLLRTDHVEEYLVKDKGVDEQLNSEFLLLFTMALHHPAFSLEHKLFFSRVLVSLINIRENRISSKHTALGYPPGFGYPTQKPLEGQTIPVKVAASCGDAPALFHQPPGLLHLPFQPPFDLMMPLLNRPGIPCGAPEVIPFPAPSISPLVSQTASPCQSRSTSPHRTNTSRPPPPSQNLLQHPLNAPPPSIPPPPLSGAPPSNVDILPIPVAPPPPPPIDQLPQGAAAALGAFNSTPEDDPVRIVPGGHNHLADRLWSLPGQPNGIRFPTCLSKAQPFLVEQMQALNLEGENSLHRSNSSDASSPNSTPPGTPSMIPVAIQGLSREEPNPGSNVISVVTGPGAIIPDRTSPPPPFNNSSVPYSLPQPFATVPPNSPFQPRATPPGCFNCGALGHVGSECTSQNIEDITQKKTYQLEYTAPLPDPEK